MVVMDQYTRRIIGFVVHTGNVDGPVLCRMFNQATSRHSRPTYLSSDNDPLFQYHRWKANMRILDIEEIKSLSHVSMSCPFVERLIGSVRRELLDQTLFWTATDLDNKLREYQCYYNESRFYLISMLSDLTAAQGVTDISTGVQSSQGLQESEPFPTGQTRHSATPETTIGRHSLVLLYSTAFAGQLQVATAAMHVDASSLPLSS